MEALVSPCTKGASGRSWTGDLFRGSGGGEAPPPRYSFHVATTRRLGGFSPIFLRRRAVILPPAFPPPPPPCYASSHSSSLIVTTPEGDMEADRNIEVGTGTAREFPAEEPLEATTAEKPQAEVAIESLGADAEAEAAKDQTPITNGSTTVHVKFKLRKLCQFGEQFLLTGEGPILGLWDPACAVAMEWSDGHVWMVKLVLPAGEEIKFKFILRGLSGEIKWQPGPDRVLQTWETTNTIVAEYGWENSEDQEITEEGQLAIVPAEEEASSTCEMGAIGEAEEQTDAEHGSDLDIAEDQCVGHAQVPSLVPGLAPLATSSTEEDASPTEVMNGAIDSVSLLSGGINGIIPKGAPGKFDTMQLEEENGNQNEAVSSNDGQLDETDSQTASGRSSEEGSNPQPAANVLENDHHWGRQTFQKLLMSLGLFQQEST